MEAVVVIVKVILSACVAESIHTRTLAGGLR